LSALFEREVAVFLVSTGTAANAPALAHLTPPWGAVLCHADSHIVTDECGAPEFFGGGLKLVGLPGEDGKCNLEVTHQEAINATSKLMNMVHREIKRPRCQNRLLKGW
jgi:threonine aldolase